MVKRAAWLSITPEPERELPAAAATLRSGRAATGSEVARERARVERLVLRSSRRRWLGYLHEVVELIAARRGSEDPEVIAAAERATAVVANHHNLLLGIPGSGDARAAADRARLNDHATANGTRDR
jgi:hypothetical protein